MLYWGYRVTETGIVYLPLVKLLNTGHLEFFEAEKNNSKVFSTNSSV